MQASIVQLAKCGGLPRPPEDKHNDVCKARGDDVEAAADQCQAAAIGTPLSGGAESSSLDSGADDAVRTVITSQCDETCGGAWLRSVHVEVVDGGAVEVVLVGPAIFRGRRIWTLAFAAAIEETVRGCLPRNTAVPQVHVYLERS